MSGLPAFLFSLPKSFFDDVDCVSDGGGVSTSNEATEAGSSSSSRAQRVAKEQGSSSTPTGEGWTEGMGATCIACGIGVNSQGFTSSAEQRQHFKTDWHRYNVKRRLDKKPPVTEAAFEAMIEQQDDVSSISGSDTDDSSDSDLSDDDDDDGEGGGRSSSKAVKGQRGSTAAMVQGAQVVFRTNGGDAFAVWRCLLLPDSTKHRQEQHSQQQLLQLLQSLRASAGSNSAEAAGPSSSSSSSSEPGSVAVAAAGTEQQQQQLGSPGCVWAMFMLRGGHFAAAVVRMNVSSSSSSKRQGSRQQQLPPPAAGQGSEAAAGSGSSSRQQQQAQTGLIPGSEPFTVLAHKTFHRYVVRAKAGGKQSTKDATGKFARSAGSRLRRYNEAALSRDITQLIKDWSSWLAAAGLVFVAAPGSNSRVLFDAAAEAAPPAGNRQGSAAAAGTLDPADPRVRRVPFVTQRPTFSELKRVLWVLGSVRKVTLPSPAEQQAAAAAAAAQDNAAVGQEKQQKQQQQGGQQQGAAAAAVVVPPMPPVKKQEDPPLIKASKAGDAERVSRLLSNGHDPTVRDTKGRSPYQLAANKEVRDAFRRFMAQAPDAWDYSSSDIPSALTEELEAAQQSKKADKRARQRAKEKERQGGKTTTAAAAGGSGSSKGAAAAAGGGGEVDAFDAELAAAMAEAAAISSRSSASSKAKQVGGSSSSSGGRRGAAGSSSAAAAARPLSAEEAARRREQLAAAAEARLKALQQKQQLW